MNCKRKNSKKSISVPIVIRQHVEKSVYSEIIIQLVKYLLYVRGQIPFNYDTFRLLINSNKSQYEDPDKNRTHIVATRRFRLCESVLKSINKLFENLKMEIVNNFENIKQMSVIFGGTPVCPKEVYVICKQECSRAVAFNGKSKELPHIMMDILRSLLKSQQLQQLLTNPLPVTNMYVLIEKNVQDVEKLEFFLPKDNYILPINCTHVNFDFNEEIGGQIFNDQNGCDGTSKILENGSSSGMDSDDDQNNCKYSWFQSIEIIKGVKDEMVNGKSIWK